MRRFSALVLVVCALASAAVLIKSARMLELDPAWAERLGVIGASGLLLSAALWKLPLEWRASASMTIVAGALALMTANLYFAFQAPDRSLDEKVDAARAAVPGYDHRTVLEVVRDRNAAAQPTVPALKPYYVLLAERPPPILPLSGIATTTTVLCNESGEYTVYESDELGFNNPRGLPDQIDVVVVGDSFAHGSCVPPGKDLTSALRDKGYSALNLGLSGSGPLIELATLIEFGLPRSPKVVVWMFGGNDFGDLSLEMVNQTLVRYLKEDGFSQDLRNRQIEVDAYWREYLASYTPPGETVRRGAARFSLREILTLFPLRSRLDLTRMDDRTEDVSLDAVIDRARRRTEASGGRFYLVTLPYWELLHDAPELTQTFPELHQRLSQLEVEVVDFLPELRASDDPMGYFPLRLPGHFNEAGYRLLADLIEREILQPNAVARRAAEAPK